MVEAKTMVTLGTPFLYLSINIYTHIQIGAKKNFHKYRY